MVSVVNEEQNQQEISVPFARLTYFSAFSDPEPVMYYVAKGQPRFSEPRAGCDFSKNKGIDVERFKMLPECIFVRIVSECRDYKHISNVRASSKRLYIILMRGLPAEVPCHVRPLLSFAVKTPELVSFMQKRRRDTNLLLSRKQYEYMATRFMLRFLSTAANSKFFSLDLRSLENTFMTEAYVCMFALQSEGASLYRDPRKHSYERLLSWADKGLTSRGEYRPTGSFIPFFHVDQLYLALDRNMKIFATLAYGFKGLRRLVLDGTPPDDTVVADCLTEFATRDAMTLQDGGEPIFLPQLEHFQWNSRDHEARLIPAQMFRVLQALVLGRRKPLKSVCLDSHRMGFRLCGFLKARDNALVNLKVSHFLMERMSFRQSDLTITPRRNQMRAFVSCVYYQCSKVIAAEKRRVLEEGVGGGGGAVVPPLWERPERAKGPMIVHMCEDDDNGEALADGADKLRVMCDDVLASFENGAEIARIVAFKWDTDEDWGNRWKSILG